MLKLDTIQTDIAALPAVAQQIVFDLVDILKKRYLQVPSENKVQDWSDFIGCMEAEPDLSRNHKTYLCSFLYGYLMSAEHRGCYLDS